MFESMGNIFSILIPGNQWGLTPLISITTVQRLGFLLETILGMKDLCEPIKNYLKTVNYYPVLLRPQKEKTDMITGNDWKVVQNVEIETDL